MRLEHLRQTGNPNRLELVFADANTLIVPAYIAVEQGLFPGKELTEEELAGLQAEVGKALTRERAVRTIAASPVSEKELRRRLTQKGADDADADEAVEWLKELHLLSDADTAAQLVQSAVHKGYGPARIKNILYEKGIPRELWEQAMRDLPQPDDAIDKYLRQKLDSKTLDNKTVKKVIDALLRRGHSWQTIRAGLERYREDMDFLPEETEILE